MLTDGVANTNLIWHANKLLALEEGHGSDRAGSCVARDDRPWSFDEKLPRNMTAHPKIDPDSGEMIFFANFPTGRITSDIEFYLANAAGELVRSQSIHGPFPALVHDFAMTKDFVISAMCPVTVSIKRAMAGGPLIAWEPEKGTHVGIMPRNGGAEAVRWFERRGLHGVAFDECVQRWRPNRGGCLPAGRPAVSVRRWVAARPSPRHSVADSLGVRLG